MERASPAWLVHEKRSGIERNFPVGRQPSLLVLARAGGAAVAAAGSAGADAAEVATDGGG